MSVPVAEATGDDEKRGDGDQIAGARPLDLGHARVEIMPEAGLRHEQDGPVQRHDHRPGHGGQEGEGPPCGRAHAVTGPRWASRTAVTSRSRS